MPAKKSLSFLLSTLILLMSFVMPAKCFAYVATDSIEAQKDLIISYIEQNKLPEADAAVTDLVLNFANYSDQPMFKDETVGFIYSAYWDKAEYAKIKELASAVISRQPDNAMWAHNYKARAAFKQGDYATTDASCQKLLSEYSHREDATWALNETAFYYQNEGRDDKARELYEEVIEKTPAGNSRLLRTHAELAKMDVQDGDFSSAEIHCQNILSNYSDHPMFDETVNIVYLAYWDKGEYAKIGDLASVVISKQPDAAMWAHNYKARAAFKLGDYATTDASCQKLLSEYSHREDATWALNETAFYYQNEGRDDKARELYEGVIQNAPSGSVNLLRTYAELARMDVLEEDVDSANIRCNKILTDFSEDPLFDEDVNRVNRAYWQKGDYAKVRELSSAVISKQPDHAMWAHNRNARAAYRLGDYAAADASCQKLAASYNHTAAAWAVREIAIYYLGDNKYDKAGQMCQLVINTWPDDINALLSRAILVAIPIRQGDIAAADLKYQKLLTDYAGHKDLPEAIFFVAEYGYYESAMRKNNPEQAQADFQKSIELINTALGLMTSNSIESGAYYYVLGLNYQKLKDYSEAVEAFANSYQSNPNFKYADYCQFAQGFCCEKLMEQGVMAQADAEAIIMSQYKQLISEFPKSDYAMYAQNWLKDNQD